MTHLEQYIEKYHAESLEKVKTLFADIIQELTIYEKTAIYKYTDDDLTHFRLNNFLRSNQHNTSNELADLIEIALSKLPNYKDVVYRGIENDLGIVQKYKDAYENNVPIVEYGFTSTTRLYSIAHQYGSIIFEIFGKNGKLIEKISKFGTQSTINEREILFNRNTHFEVTDFIVFSDYTLITLNEL